MLKSTPGEQEALHKYTFFLPVFPTFIAILSAEKDLIYLLIQA